MTTIFFLVGFLAGLGGAPESAGTLAPHLPFFDWGACPFECCTYREWTANAPIQILKSRRHNAPVAFELKQGEEVRGITGVVVTTRAGEARVFRSIEIGKKRLKVSPGEIVYILHYEGEGYWKFWLRGQIDSDQIPDIDDSAVDAELDLRIVIPPETSWWVKVKNTSGQVGWTDETEHFDHMDACE